MITEGPLKSATVSVCLFMTLYFVALKIGRVTDILCFLFTIKKMNFFYQFLGGGQTQSNKNHFLTVNEPF